MSGLSTETLRKIYADGDTESEWFFDTWLAKHDAWTADAERERIIKLLEGIDYLSDCCIQPNCCVTTGELIALIKGENK